MKIKRAKLILVKVLGTTLISSAPPRITGAHTKKNS